MRLSKPQLAALVGLRDDAECRVPWDTLRALVRRGLVVMRWATVVRAGPPLWVGRLRPELSDEGLARVEGITTVGARREWEA